MIIKIMMMLKVMTFFSIRYVSVNLFSLYGYFVDKYSAPKLVNVSDYEAMHFSYYDQAIDSNHSRILLHRMEWCEN